MKNAFFPCLLGAGLLLSTSAAVQVPLQIGSPLAAQTGSSDPLLSLSDRFGLWLGFHPLTQDTFFEILEGYCKHFGLEIGTEQLHREAIEWSMTRGSRSGRVAWQFIQDLAGRLGKTLG